jgi:glycerol-3-phosphate dehydrogenase subunit B
MPSVDVVVVGTGLAGLASAVLLAEDGARVAVVAAGSATLSWAGGPLDIAAVSPTGSTPRHGVATLATRPGHPYAFLAGDVEAALTWFCAAATGDGLAYEGDLDRPLRPLPTALGAVRPAAIVPAGMADALAPWRPGEGLAVVGIHGDKDLWPAAVAAGLRRAFAAQPGAGPTFVRAVDVALPEVADRRNRSALDLARRFDEPGQRRAMLGRIAEALGSEPAGERRVAVPAVLGLEEHAAALAEAREVLGGLVFELPMVPPSVPGLRLHAALRRRLLRLGGRILLGEAVARVELDDGRVARVIMPAAARETTIHAPALVLATGGLTGGGLVALESGQVRETVLDLPVEVPPSGVWLATHAGDPGGHPIAAAGIRTDDQLRPIIRRGASPGPRMPAGVRVVGGLLAGQRYLDERCGDGVALASAWRAAASIRAEAGAAPRRAAA